MEKFKKPPITEALFDLRVELPNQVTITDLEKLHLLIKDEYPEIKPRHLWKSSIKFEEGNTQTIAENLGIDAYQFWSTDKKQVLQYQLDGFSFSRLQPYPQQGWDALFPELQKLWIQYRNKLNPLLVTRQAVRYINRIDIPFAKFELDAYFTQAPKVPQKLPQNIEEFLSRIVIRYPESQAKGVITLAKSNPTNTSSDITSIILDIDVFIEVNLDPQSEKIQNNFSLLRKIKNEVFNESLTETSKELFR